MQSGTRSDNNNLYGLPSHLVRYYIVFAPKARHRTLLMAKPRVRVTSATEEPKAQASRAALTRVQRLRRVYDIAVSRKSGHPLINPNTQPAARHRSDSHRCRTRRSHDGKRGSHHRPGARSGNPRGRTYRRRHTRAIKAQPIVINRQIPEKRHTPSNPWSLPKIAASRFCSRLVGRTFRSEFP